MILLDVTHTSHTTSQSGIQQVTRNLFAALSETEQVQAIIYDPYAKRFRPTDRNEEANLTLSPNSKPNSAKRGASWSQGQKLRGLLQRYLTTTPKFSTHLVSAIIVPEIIPPKTPIEAYLNLRTQTNAPLTAVFHDAIALKFPELTPDKTVQYFPHYLEKLRQFDKIAAVSQSSQTDLLEYWSNQGKSPLPETKAIPLGTHPAPSSPSSSLSPSLSPMILFVGSIEGRKNHLAALEALEQLWSEGLEFSLELVGGSVPETGQPAIDLLEQLVQKGRPITAHGPSSDAQVNDCYHRCAFTLYPSLWEGYGMPVIESLQRGKPSVCSDRGGLAETIIDGGCLIPQTLDSIGIANSVKTLIEKPQELSQLTKVTKNISFKSWQQYAHDIKSC